MVTVFALFAIFYLITTGFVTTLPTVVKIGAIFTEDQKDSAVELAFKYAVYRINRDRNILPNTTLMYDIQHVPHDDSFHASKKACMQVSSGVSAIFGPQDPLLGSHIQSLCDALDIPHVECRLDMEPEIKEFSINLHPSPRILGNSIRDLIRYLNWTKVAVIYEEDMSLISLQELLRPPLPRELQVIFRKSNKEMFRQVLRDIKSRGIYSVIVDTKPDSLPVLLQAILQVQMNDYKYYYHFTTFDLEAYSLEDFNYNFVNMTAYRMVDADHPSVRQTLKDMEKFQPIGQHILNRTNVIKVEPALMYDSVYALAHGIHSLHLGATLRPTNVSCEDEVPWNDGSSLFNYINSAEFRGLTGKIQFKEGRRNSLKLDLLKLRDKKLEKVGEWSTTNGLNITNHTVFHEFSVTNITLKVTTIESRPYVMLKAERNLTGNERFEGFCIDLLKTIADLLGFSYELHLVPDKKFGAENTTTGEWNGLVREIIDKDSKIDTYQKMWRYMESRPAMFVSTYDEGVRRVLEGNYAFLMESTMLDFMVQRDCNLTQVGGLLDSKGYGIATPMGSPWRDKISLTILDLQEKGVIHMLYNKWWKSPGIMCSRDDKNKESKANSLGVDNIGGVFVVLLCGLAIAILTAILEFFWNSRKNAQTERNLIFCSTQQSLCSEMAQELRFAVKCRASRQRPALRRQCSKCIPGTTYVPAAMEVPQENGIMQMIEMRKSPVTFDCTES
ncbi:glutamate receptor ionotropic, kainate 2 isoform X5 [Centruroides vittatus]|uniref:glutamate receptor ionotropic, kainate 2 isoform X5 n=1 Tax=Centruroides vittatus TaxID=120091 RepID=UPI00350E8EFD